MKGKTTFLAKAFLMLFAVLFSLTGARAQQALPYEYGFENNDLAAEGWTIVDGAGSTGITTAAVQNGSYGFQFYYNTNPPQYLISPELSGTENGVTVSFSYKKTGTYTETFKVGYSTTTSDVDAFEWEAEITAPTEWTLYEATFPAGTKYVAVAYTANDQFKMYLDDFSFTIPTTVAKPTGLKVSYEGGTEATVSWSSDASAFDIDVNDVVTEDVPNPYTLTGLSLGTTYTIKVRAKEGTDVSGWSAPVSFTTEFPVFSLPYEDGFENGIAAWTLVDCTSGTGISTTYHEGTKSFTFKYNSNPPQYLISPEFEGTSPMTVSFWYRVQSSTYPETFQVGYSTTTKDVDAFTWGEEVTATNNAEWLQYEANFPAGTKFVAVRYNSNDKYYLFVDDFSFTVDNGVAKPTGLKVDNIGAKTADLSWAENGEATAWEICLNGDETNLIAADSNPFTLTGLTPETDYTAKVRAVSGSAKSTWSNEVAFTTDVEFPAPKDLAVVPASKGATVSWTGKADATSYNLRYREAPLGGTLTTDFEDSSLGEWTTIDADGDGFCWDLTTNLGNFSHHNESADCVTSSSYDSNAGALNPDNYLVSPQVLLGGSITFWACAQDASYAAEHFGVAVSTTSNTDPSAFTTIQEWTMTSAGTPSSRRKAAGTWGEYTVDLSAYAGQTGYVAIRHFNCSDFFYLNIDDITIEQPAGTEEPWTTVTGATSPYTIEGLTPETKYQVEVQGVYADGESKWAGTSFTTLEDVPTPSALAVSDVTWGTAKLSWTENGEATAWQICLNGDVDAPINADSNPFTLEGLTPETEYTAMVRALQDGKNSKWSDEVTFTTDIQFYPPTNLAVNNITATSAEISWTADAAATGAVLEYATTEGAGLTFTEYKYDNGTNASSVGLGGGAFSWGVMFPAGSYEGNSLNKVSVFDVAAMTGSVSIYSGGDTAPGTEIATKPITLTGAGAFVDVSFDGLTFDATQNLWVIVNNESGEAYPAATATDEVNDPNGRWVEISGSWYDLANAGITGQNFMVRAEIGTIDINSLNNWTTVAVTTSPYELTGLNPETTYFLRVKSVYADGESKYTSTLFTTESLNPVPSNIKADLAADGATLTWDGLGESYNVQYRKAESAGEPIFEDNFNNGLDQWTIVTAGEGPGWVIGTETGGNAATAYSWNSAGSYNADNWLISPAVELGGVLKFFANTATSYPDSYEVLLSTTGTEIADFTETLQAMAAATPGTVTIDLSAYAGQTGYIAFHHVSNDCYLLVIDDFGVYAPNVPASEWENMAVTEKTATISGLATNDLYEYQIQSVKGDKTSEWSKLADFALLTLDSNADNTKAINQYNGKYAHVTLDNRTFYQDNTWNTIYLPFDMTLDEVDASPLAGGDIRTLTNNITVEDYTVTLNFTAEGEALTTWGGNKFYGGVPYIVKWASGSNIENPQFANVTITNAAYYVGDQTKVMFEGTYAPKEFAAEERSILFIGEGNKFNWPLAGAKIGAMRGFFELVGMEAEIASNSIKIYSNLDDEDPTGIANLNEVKDSSDWYDLSGRKLAGKPAMKGIYVNGGRKVTVK
jgi:hypothetical protein